MIDTDILEDVARCYKKYITNKEQKKAYNKMRAKIRRWREIEFYCELMAQNSLINRNI